MVKVNKRGVGFKLIMVSILTLLLLIPSIFIMNLIRERENRSNEVKHEISSKWGGRQIVAGPFISVPGIQRNQHPENKSGDAQIWLHVLPAFIEVNGEIIPEKRYRSLYETVVYNADLEISGYFVIPTEEEITRDGIDLKWNEAGFYTGIDDMKGIKNKVEILFSGKKYEANPVVFSRDLASSGIGISNLEINDMPEGSILKFSFRLDLNGSENISFYPVGKETVVNLASKWDSPSFTGNYLPEVRTVTDTGFSAKWNIFHLNRSYPQHWYNNEYSIYQSEFGVDFVQGVDNYQKNMRTAKYSLMIIGLTFLAFFMIEIMNKLNIHPVQYILTGFAITIFYTLLLSFSEYMNFDLAYLISAGSVITLISLYSLSLFREKTRVWIVTGVLVLLYLYLFVVLQLKDFSLLIGSIGLFIVIATVMYLTRKINWYEIGSEDEKI